jgi:hypothetical protein
MNSGPADMVNHRAQLNTMAEALLTTSGIEFDRASQLEQALVGTFYFGMLHAYGMSNHLEPPLVHALALATYEDSLHYTPAAAAEAVRHCVDATNPSNHLAMNAILHRGIDGHAQYIEDDLLGLARNINGVLQHYRATGG